MLDLKEALEIIHGSKYFDFDGSVLTIRGYWSGKELKLDLGALDEEMLEQLQVEEDEEAEDDYYE